MQGPDWAPALTAPPPPPSPWAPQGQVRTLAAGDGGTSRPSWIWPLAAYSGLRRGHGRRKGGSSDKASTVVGCGHPSLHWKRPRLWPPQHPVVSLRLCTGSHVFGSSSPAFCGRNPVTRGHGHSGAEQSGGQRTHSSDLNVQHPNTGTAHHLPHNVPDGRG